MTRLILGGPTRPVLAGLERLRAAGYRPVLVTGSPEPGEIAFDEILDEYPEIPALRLARLRRRPAPWADLATLAALTATVRRLRPGIVHTHTAKAGALGRLAVRLARNRRVRAVHTFHGHSLTRKAGGRLAPVWVRLERVLGRRASDLIVALSPRSRDELVDLLGPRLAPRLVSVPLAFDAARHAAAPVGAKPPPWPVRAPGERVLAFLGRGVPVKGLDVLARAHARLGARDAPAAHRLRIVTIGALAPQVRAAVTGVLAAAGLGDRWLHLGPMINPAAWLGAVDGLALPSWSEGTPVAILEALALGLPVLASRVGGVEDLLASAWSRHGPGEWTVRPAPPRGALLPPGEPEAWAAALARFVEDPDRIPGEPEARRRFVEEVFDPDRNTADLAALYRRIGAADPAPPATTAAEPPPERATQSPARRLRQ